MSVVLNIDTSSKSASVSLARNGEVIGLIRNADVKEHAAFLQPAIAELIQQNNIRLRDIDAVAVANGPGSYTGLRVGLASAKGICFSIQKPLITINTLKMMAAAVAGMQSFSDEHLLCPMIDARRQEVFTALYSPPHNEVMQPTALILTPDSFSEILQANTVIFFGDGAIKWKMLTTHTNADFCQLPDTVSALASLSFSAFKAAQFADLAYAEPFYLKEFFNG